MNANKKKRIFLVLIIGFCATFSFAQDKVIQVIYFDSDWNRTSTEDGALYSRAITFYENDLHHPIELVKDYYLESGNLLREGEYSYYDLVNEENNKLQGLSTLYYDNGEKSYQCQYNDKGELFGLLKYWYENGELQVTYDYHNGKLDGLISFYNIKGVLQKTVNYVDGVVNGFTQVVSLNGEAPSADLYSDDKI